MTNRAATEDKDFVKAFEAFEISASDFDHRSHIRMAYTYLCDHDVETTCRRVRDVLCRFLKLIGVEPASKYHETMTRAWTLAVCHFMVSTPDTRSAAEFIDANPKLLDKTIMMMHYSNDVMFSNAARRAFVEPDLVPIPRYDASATR
ncbi:MAG: hypothetical protein ACR2NP_17000 [Pirellulaceae bacterium]